MLRAVFDTNGVVSALVFRKGTLTWLRAEWQAGRVIPVVSAETVAELVRVLTHPKFELTEEETKAVLSQYMEHAEAVTRVSTRVRLPQCRDPEDRMFLRLAYAAKPEALVTGDRDLLALSGQSRIPILTPEAFKSRHQRG